MPKRRTDYHRNAGLTDLPLTPRVRLADAITGCFAPYRFAVPAICFIGAGLSPALAQESATTATGSLERVEITGSSIKRIDAETALPVQIIRRDDIDKAGVTTAAELLTKVSANAAGLTDGASVTDISSGQRGFNAANLRGIGVSSTLVLLNGRRLANFASPGDSDGVDLNNVPAAAIDRVEILKDGASAIYGTDAIGGVINFITRKDYRGVDVAVSRSITQEGGAGKTTASIAGGFGDLATDRFNVFGVLDIQKLQALRSSQRDFIAENDIPKTLPNLLSSRTFPANIRLTNAQLNALKAAGFPYTSRTINLSAPACNPPGTVYAPGGPGGRDGCTFNYMADTEIYPESKKLGLLTRGTLALTPDDQLFAEVLASRAKTKYTLSPNPIAVTGFTPASPYYPTQLGITSPLEVRLRMAEAGNRSNEVTSDALRVLVGATGKIGEWDYNTGFGHAVNKATDADVDGYVSYSGFVSAVRTGQVNPFGPSTAQGLAVIDSLKVSDDTRVSKGTTDTIDVKGSRTLLALAGGDLAVAVGAELRREKVDFTPSALLIANDIAGDRDNSGSQPPLAATSDSRNVTALFTEFNAPFTKTVEAQFAIRFDRYQNIGNTTNPKFGLRWVPAKELLFRASVGTGFRAPTISDLNRPTVFGVTASVLPDPVLCATATNLADCSDQWPVERRSNPNLKPEKSLQFSLGTVVEPIPQLSLSVDYWNIQKKDVIADLGEETVLANPTKYANLVTRDADGFITNIVLQKENQGKLKTSGFDLGANWRGPVTGYGRFSAGLNGTYVLMYKKQPGEGEDYINNLGQFVNDKTIQRWRHRINADWDFGPANLSLSNTYYSGYRDQNTAIDLETGDRLPDRDVKHYSLWDLTGSYQVTKQFKVSAGILNLFDTQPPFTNQAYYFLASYDPTYADPRGRSFYAKLSYSF